MAYQVDRFNGQFLVAVDDGTIDTTTDLRLVGKNYAGYGELQNENFVHLLENFANITPPPRAISGQIWYDNSKKRLRYYDGTRFKTAGGAEVGPTGPAGLSEGEFWWNSDTKQLFAWAGTEFELVGPEVSPDLGQSIISSSPVKDTFGNTNIILKVIVDDETVAVISKTAFTLDSAENAIPNFSEIKKGMTLVRTNGETGVTSDDFFFWGTAANTNRLGGVPAAEYLRRGSITFSDDVGFLNPGFTVGNDNDFRIFIEQSDAILEHQLGNKIVFRITDGTAIADVANIDKISVYPGQNNIFDLGKDTFRWKDVYAITVSANLVGNVTGNTEGTHTGNVIANDNTVLVNATTKEIGGTGVNIIGNFTGAFAGSVTGTSDNALTLQGSSPSLTAIPQTVAVRNAAGDLVADKFVGIADKAERTRINNAASDDAWSGATPSTQYRSAKTITEAFTIAARDSNGDIFARLFQGTATSARYADLAEKYLADKEYTVGTVVVVGGDAEVTASSAGQKAIGVVSANPAFMMNAELQGGTYIALKGRVPVRVTGQVKKGDQLIADANGTATVYAGNSSAIFAIALESNDKVETKLIEAVVL